jgi:small-conductance mechanosensitive channel/CRP-like cAMP-binding protein
MPSSDLIANTALFVAVGLLLALIGLRIARPWRKTIINVSILMVIGMLGLLALAEFSGALGDMTMMLVLRELSLLLVAVGLTLVLLTFVFQGLLAKAAVPRILADVLLVLVLIGFALYRMSVAGVNLGSIITTSAVITGVIAFSLQETLGNLWGGIALQLDNTCRLGDWIRVEGSAGQPGVTGQIVGIRWRCLAVATNDGETVMVPNARLIKNPVTVLARRGDAKVPFRRHVGFRVAYEVPPAKVIATIEAALARAEIPNVAAAPVATCVCTEFGAQSISYDVLYWLTDLAYDLATDSQVLAHVFATLARNDMEIPLPRNVLLTPRTLAAKRAAAARRELAARIEVLSRLHLFASLTDAERETLAAELTEAPYLAGDIVSREGDVSDSMFILARGTVDIFRGGSNGERQHLAKLTAPECFGEMGLLTGQARVATVIAETEVLCYRLERSGFDATLRARPALAEAISHTVAERQAANDATLRALSDEARAHRASGTAAELVRRIQTFFRL